LTLKPAASNFAYSACNTPSQLLSDPVHEYTFRKM
jgi:hypothetical protein